MFLYQSNRNNANKIIGMVVASSLSIISLSPILLVAPLIAHHFKPPATNIPLSPRTQIPPNVTIDVGQDAIVANGTTVLIRCNITQVSD